MNVPKQHKCILCEEHFSTKEECTWHTINDPHRSLLRPCKYCGTSCTNKSDLIKHEKWHLAKNKTCSICDKEFKTRQRMLTHIEIMHDNILICCKLCNKSYKSKSGLVYHMKIVHNQNNVFTCKTTSRPLLSQRRVAPLRSTGMRPTRDLKIT